MAFQVIADAVERDIEIVRIRIQFHSSNLVDRAGTETKQTETGTLVVSTPETTVFDLVRFPSASGYWSNIATVLSELAELLDPTLLAAGAGRVSRSDVQRLGWLLDFLDHGELAATLAEVLRGQRLVPTPLSTFRDSAEAALENHTTVCDSDLQASRMEPHHES